MARAIIQAANPAETDVPSPTFTLVQTYELGNGTPLWHLDLYRIESPEDAMQLGLDDAFIDAVCLIEWPDRLGAATPPDRLELDIRHEEGDDAGKRQVRITGRGKWESRVDDL